jgi:hypothetical protein
MGSNRFFITLVSADSDPVRFKRHLSGQARALADFGVNAQIKPGWPESNTGSITLVHAVDASTGKTVGGMCVNFRRDGILLPTEENLRDPDLTREIETRAGENPCELCGTWISSAYRKRGLVSYLFHGAVAAAYLGGARVSISSAHEKSASIYSDLGVSVDTRKCYFWPDERYRTYIVRFDVIDLMNHGPRGSEKIWNMVSEFRSRRRYEFSLGQTPELTTLLPAYGN